MILSDLKKQTFTLLFFVVVGSFLYWQSLQGQRQGRWVEQFAAHNFNSIKLRNGQVVIHKVPQTLKSGPVLFILKARTSDSRSVVSSDPSRNLKPWTGDTWAFDNGDGIVMRDGTYYRSLFVGDTDEQGLTMHYRIVDKDMGSGSGTVKLPWK